LLLIERTGFSETGWALPAYSVASVGYGILFAWYIAVAVANAANYAIRTPQYASHQIVDRIGGGDYLGAMMVGGTMIVSLGCGPNKSVAA
jgi:hypothetical protein